MEQPIYILQPEDGTQPTAYSESAMKVNGTIFGGEAIEAWMESDKKEPFEIIIAKTKIASISHIKLVTCQPQPAQQSGSSTKEPMPSSDQSKIPDSKPGCVRVI